VKHFTAKNLTADDTLIPIEHQRSALAARPRRAPAGGLALVALAIAIAGCTRPLPEEGSVAERTYTERCGSCHRPYQPHSMTAAMWQAQMTVMRQKIAAAGQPPLTAEQERMILEYLQRNAGG
jgi:Dihaem cytochrome c